MTATIKRLHFILGPTASGKTELAIQRAQELHTEIISCDSRQFYHELNIGVARPSTLELAAAKHHFVACRSVSNPYNVFTFEQEALACLRHLFLRHDTVIAVGGSGLYIEALRKGISVLPDPAPGLRESLQQKLQQEGVESLRTLLKVYDPDYYARVDLANGVRIQRALEVSITAGIPYSKLVNQPPKPRPFDITTEVISRPNDQLRQRINARAGQMVAQGLEQEARQLFPLRHLTPLNTVGYKEFFALWEPADEAFPLSESQLTQVADLIKLNTWHYAKKQITWLKKKV